jgi:hypothetical protein
MPTKSTEYIKKAALLGNTVASSNLAYDLMNIGFAEEANKLLEEARQTKNPHENVGSAIARLAQIQADEDKLEKELFEVARERQRFSQSLAEAYFTKRADEVSFEGVWEFPENIQVKIDENNGEITAEWTQDNKEHRLSGYTNNRGAKITIDKMKYSYTASKEVFQKDSSGYAYISSDNKQLLIMKLEDGKPSFIRAHRKQSDDETVSPSLEVPKIA